MADIASSTSALLGYKRVQFKNKMATTKGFGGDWDTDTWIPDLPNGWYYLGQAVTNEDGSIPYSIIVKELAPNVLKDVKGWEMIWGNSGSQSKRWLSLWHGIPPTDDYVVLGGIFSTNDKFGPPTDAQTRGIKAVRKDALVLLSESGSYAGPHAIWTNVGDGSTRDGSIWDIVDEFKHDYADILLPNAMVPNGEDDTGVWHRPQGNWLWLIIRSKTVDLTSAAEKEQAEKAKAGPPSLERASRITNTPVEESGASKKDKEAVNADDDGA